MIYNFLSLLFFCGVCVSAFGQELQSPQINQNAIFANPALAGSKGQTRVCTALSVYHAKYKYYTYADDSNNGFSNRNIYNGMVSIDGLIMKNRLGIAGYLKNEFFQINNTYNFYQNNSYTGTQHINYHYTNMYMGLMLAPKFQLTAHKLNKQDHVLSPALAIGFRGTQFSYSGPDFYNYATEDSIINGDTKTAFKFDYVSLGLVYSSPNSYAGVKCNFKNYMSNFILYGISVVYAKTYSNKKVENPKFSFTHQFQICIPTYDFYRINGYVYNYYDNKNERNLNSYLNVNLDFRYGKVIFGNFLGFTEYAGYYAGITGGLQLNSTKIIVNYSPKLSLKSYGSTGLFISANFLFKPKSKTYR